MKWEDLTQLEKTVLIYCNNNRNYKYIGKSKRIIDTLGGYGLVRFIGNLQYELTKEGKNLLISVC